MQINNTNTLYSHISFKNSRLFLLLRTLIANSMAPPATRYSYELIPNAIKAFSTPDSPIVILSKNVVFTTVILEKFKDNGFKDFVSYLAACPLRCALVDLASYFLPQHVYKFYYTSTYYDPGMIIGTTGDGQHIILMIATDVRRALRIPI